MMAAHRRKQWCSVSPATPNTRRDGAVAGGAHRCVLHAHQRYRTRAQSGQPYDAAPVATALDCEITDLSNVFNGRNLRKLISKRK